MGKSQRTKGATFERKVCEELTVRLGGTFRRNLTQYQEKDGSDICTPEGFPFAIECKHHTTAKKPEWWRQAVTAAQNEGKRPAVIYRLTGGPIRCIVDVRDAFECVTRGKWSSENHLMEIDLDAFAYLAREGICAGMGPP